MISVRIQSVKFDLLTLKKLRQIFILPAELKNKPIESHNNLCVTWFVFGFFRSVYCLPNILIVQ